MQVECELRIRQPRPAVRADRWLILVAPSHIVGDLVRKRLTWFSGEPGVKACCTISGDLAETLTVPPKSAVSGVYRFVR